MATPLPGDTCLETGNPHADLVVAARRAGFACWDTLLALAQRPPEMTPDERGSFD